MTYGPFDVWAPRASRVRLVAAGETIDMVRDDGDWWSPVGPVPDPEGEEVDYGYLIDDDETPRPDPRSRRQPDGVHGLSRTHDSTLLRVAGRQLDRSPARGRGDLRAAHRHVHARGHLRRRARRSSTTCATSASTSSR